MSRSLPFVWVDVFSSVPLAGNGLVVFTDARALTDAELQRLARETHQAETTFVFPRAPEVEAERGVRVRIFTPSSELPFAGHPTLGTAAVLRRPGQSGLALDLDVGRIDVAFEGDRVTLTAKDPAFGALHDPARVAKAAGLPPEALQSVPVRTVSTGLAYAVVLLRSVESLSALQPDHAALDAALAGTGATRFYFLAPAPPLDAARFRARMFDREGEDPATGSAASCAISHLVHEGVVGSGEAIVLTQGMELGRPSRLHVSAERRGDGVTAVRVGGAVAVLGRGAFELP
jgi:trans-2,3-dihydro-3-hydroxyanthranilate isomerase